MEHILGFDVLTTVATVVVVCSTFFAVAVVAFAVVASTFFDVVTWDVFEVGEVVVVFVVGSGGFIVVAVTFSVGTGGIAVVVVVFSGASVTIVPIFLHDRSPLNLIW